MKPDTTATTRTRPTHASARSFMRRHGFGPYVVDWHLRTIPKALESLGWRVPTIERDPQHALWHVSAYAPEKVTESQKQLRKAVRGALRQRQIEILDDILEVVPSGKRIVVSLVSDRDRPRPVDVEAILAEGIPEED
jgi:hypothetical protein